MKYICIYIHIRNNNSYPTVVHTNGTDWLHHFDYQVLQQQLQKLRPQTRRPRPLEADAPEIGPQNKPDVMMMDQVAVEVGTVDLEHYYQAAVESSSSARSSCWRRCWARLNN